MFVKSPALSPEQRRDRRVTFALLFFWGTVVAAWAYWWFWPLQFESFVASAIPIIAFVYVAIIIYVVYACLVHVNSWRYKGEHPIALSLVLFAGHVISTTIYHFFVVLRR
jgi:membrane protein YdbS with pleckstrin-like domain